MSLGAPVLTGIILSGLVLADTALASSDSRAPSPTGPPDAEASVRLLRQYIEIDTTNPPGNEVAGARFLAEIIDRAEPDAPQGEALGIEQRMLTSPGGRTSFYARLPATVADPGEALVLTHHIDVVPADGDWSVPPFSGRPHNGKIWGRGAVDVKSLGIAHLVVMLRLATDQTPRHRDLIYLALADEEAGGQEGAGWLLDAHPELFTNVSGVLGEGGTNRVAGQQVMWWGIEVDQKRPLWLRLTARGRGGHGSMPLLETATHTLIEGLARVTAQLPVYRAPPSAWQFFRAVAAVEGSSTQRGLERLEALLGPGAAPLTAPPSVSPAWLGVLYDSLQVTRVQASDTINVIAPEAHAWLDIRLLPDTDQDAYLEQLQTTLGPGIEIEILLEAPEAQASSTETDLFQTLTRELRVRGNVVPVMIPGITDSRYFRQRGIPAYGWNPFVFGGLHGVHGTDESIPEAAFVRGIETVARVVRAMLTPPD